MRTPVGFGRSALGKNTLDDIASKNFLKSASDQVVLFLHLFFRCHLGSKDVVVGAKVCIYEQVTRIAPDNQLFATCHFKQTDRILSTESILFASTP